MKVLKGLQLACFLFLVASGSQTAAQSFASHVKTGAQMPSFTVTDGVGKEIKLADLKGKVVLLNFWATWCGPCVAEMPRLEREVWEKYKSPEFMLVAVAREQTQQEIAAFARQHRLTFPVASDPHRDIYRIFADAGIPRSYVVGPDGTVLFQSVGYQDSEFTEMVAVIERELAKIRSQKQ